MSDLKKKIQEERVENVTRSWGTTSQFSLEKDHPGRNLGEGMKPIGQNGNEEKKEDRVLAQMKRIQAHVSV